MFSTFIKNTCYPVGKIRPVLKNRLYAKKSLIVNNKFAYIGVVVDDDVQELNPCCEVTENVKYRVKILDGWDSKTHKGDKPAEFVYPNPLNYPAGITRVGVVYLGVW